MAGALLIRQAWATELAAFFAYLDEHLGENGRDGAALFMPLARGDSRLPVDKQHAFITGMATALFDPGWRRLWLAFDAGGAIAGHIDLRARPERPAAHRALLGMGVRRDVRKAGLGAQLIGAAVAWARSEAALDWIDLEVLSGNEPARRLYARCGFVRQGEIADMFRIDGEALGYTYMSLKVR